MKSEAGEGSGAPLLVSESGISSVGVINELRETGFQGFLMGEIFMKTENPGESLKKFIDNLNVEK